MQGKEIGKKMPFTLGGGGCQKKHGHGWGGTDTAVSIKGTDVGRKKRLRDIRK